MFKSRYHRDGSVTLWNVYTQTWERGFTFEDRVLASLSVEDRAKVQKHFAKEN
jgi:hypothetical protein